MCGATDQQKTMWNQQSQFFQTLQKNYGTVFGEQQGVLSKLTSGMQSIFQAGPTQEGFAPEEKAAINTQITQGTAETYKKASAAVGEKIAAAGGGDEYLPSGSMDQIKGNVAAAAAGTESNQKLDATLKNYEQGNANWRFASQGLGEVAGLENPNAAAGETTGAGNAASKTANDMAQADMAGWGIVGGALGGIGGAAMGGWAQGGFKH